jgi:hypothetical protein
MISPLHQTFPPGQTDHVETELAKDIWDVRNLPGVHYASHRSDHLINFTLVTPFFAR